jgi:hypothetical protein
MKLIKQKTRTSCGQCCVAMVFEIPLEEAIAIVGHDGIMNDEEMYEVIGSDALMVSGKPQEGVVAIQKHKDPNGNREHWTVWNRNVTLDPANIGSKLWPVYKHFEVDWA